VIVVVVTGVCQSLNGRSHVVRTLARLDEVIIGERSGAQAGGTDGGILDGHAETAQGCTGDGIRLDAVGQVGGVMSCLKRRDGQPGQLANDYCRRKSVIQARVDDVGGKRERR
jgi:hypothetical protein